VFYTRRFLNLRVLKHGDWKIWTFLPYKTTVFQYRKIFESPCSETRRLKNLRVLEHGDKILYKKIKITNFKIPIEERKLNLLSKNFQQHAVIYTGHWFPEIFSLENQTFFKSPCFIHRGFTFKDYNSVKKQQKTEVF